MKNINGVIEKGPAPKVIFELPTEKDETQTIFNFCYRESSGGWNWSEYVYNYHPELKKIIDGVDDEKEFYNCCHTYVKSYLEKHHNTIEQAVNEFQKKWKEIEKEFYDNISKDFETVFPEEIKKIKVSVSINPICPRYLDKWSFNVFYKQSEDTMKKTCIHEIIHFLYFKKWLEIFPNYDKKTFNGPHSEWKLSEILVNPIMNNNQTIQKIINKQKSYGYREFRDIRIGNETLNDYFGNIYKKHLDGEITFSDFLEKCWDKYNKHKDIIERDIKK